MHSYRVASIRKIYKTYESYMKYGFKPNSITRFNNGMYGSESGMCGYLTNMVWQIKELEKRFVNKNYILQETIAIMCTLYHFYVENMQRYPLGTEANMEWCRFYYEQCYKPYEHLIDEGTLNTIFMQVAAGQNIAGKGVIPKVTFYEFMDEVKSKPYTHNPMHDVGGSVIEIPQTTPENYPVEVTEYMDNIMPVPKMNTNTNLARMDGMQRMLDKDREQRKEFLEKEVVPNIKKDQPPMPVFNDIKEVETPDWAKEFEQPAPDTSSDKTGPYYEYPQKIPTEVGDTPPYEGHFTCKDGSDVHTTPDKGFMATCTNSAEFTNNPYSYTTLTSGNGNTMSESYAGGETKSETPSVPANSLPKYTY